MSAYESKYNRIHVYLVTLAYALLFMTLLCSAPLMAQPLPMKRISKVTGRIVDPEGFGVSGAKIEIYSGNSLVTSVETEVDGTFAVYLEVGTYIFKVKKEGYAKLSFSVAVQSTGVQDLGDIELDYCISAKIPFSFIEAKPGDIVQIPLQVRNRGYYDEEVTFSAAAPADWRVYIKYGNFVVRQFTLSPDESISFQLIIETPLKTGLYSISLNFSTASGVSITKNLTINLTTEGSAVLSADTLFKSTRPGAKTTFTFKITNPLNKQLRFNVAAVGNVNWFYAIKGSKGEEIASVVLDGGRSTSLTLEIYVPHDAEEGDYVFNVSVSNELFNESLTFTLHVERGYPIIVVEPLTPSLDVYSGSTGNFRLKITNIGTSDAVVSFNVEGLPSDYVYRFKDSQGNIVSRLFVKAGETQILVVSVSTPPGAEPQLIKFNVTLSAGSSTCKLSLELNILGKYELTYTTENYYVETVVGESVQFKLTLKNTGYNELRNIVVSILKYPEGFNVTVQPDIVPVLKPGESTTFTIDISTSSDLSAGDYYIIVKAKSSEISADPVSIHVFLKPRTELTYLGILAIIVSIVVLFLVYRRYGRR